MTEAATRYEGAQADETQETSSSEARLRPLEPIILMNNSQSFLSRLAIQSIISLKRRVRPACAAVAGRPHAARLLTLRMEAKLGGINDLLP